jgi:hypothetical protein
MSSDMLTNPKFLGGIAWMNIHQPINANWHATADDDGHYSFVVPYDEAMPGVHPRQPAISG